MDKTAQNKGTQSTDATEVEVPKEENIFDLMKIVFYGLAFAFVLRVLAFEPFVIPSESMLPTLATGDYIIISKSSYGYSKHSLPFVSVDLFDGRIMESPVERGDVAVFKLPRDNSSDYIKRIIGLPGDKVQMINGVLFINGQAVKKVRVDDFVIKETPNTNCNRFPMYRVTLDAETTACSYPQYRETLPNGRSYMTLDLLPAGNNDTTRVFTVPAGHYFGMGDNRDNSTDSRYPVARGVGFIPAENLVGRASVIFWSTDGASSWLLPWTWFSAMRGDRVFNSLSPAGSAD